MLRILPAVFTLFIAGCSSGGFTDHLAFQNRIAAGARKPADSASAIVREDLTLQFRRGTAASVFSATMAEGSYVGILETDEGMFFLAPWGAFFYEMNDQPESAIGGIFVRREDQKPFVWFIPKQGSEAEWKAWLVGDRIEKVKPGLTNIAFRPWVESDFQVPAEKVDLKKRGPIQPAQTTSGS